jgi:hypothetical protein
MGDWQDIFNPAKWLENISEVGKGILKPLLDSVTGMFKKDGILSGEMLGTVFQALVFSEIFGKDDTAKDAIRQNTEAFKKALPEFVKAKIAAGTMEATALEDANQLIELGFLTKRNTDGTIKSQVQIKDSQGRGTGRRDLYNRVNFGSETTYQTDEQGNIVKHIDEQGKQVPTVISEGVEGQYQLENRQRREQERLDRGAYAANQADIYSKETGTGKTVGEGFREFEESAAPYLDPTQEQQATSLQALLASQDPSKLSGSEMTNVERGLGRMGIGVGRTAEMDKYKAAMTFGDALAQKQQRLGAALAQTAPVAASFKSGYNPGVLQGQSAVQNVSQPGNLSGFGTSAGTVYGGTTGLTEKFQDPSATSDSIFRDMLVGGKTKGK